MSIVQFGLTYTILGVMNLKYDRIRNLREDIDMTQSQIAGILNISQRTYSRYENDEHAIPIEILSALADFHQTSVDYLIDRKSVV